jgi:signal transduction histidine kinase
MNISKKESTSLLLEIIFALISLGVILVYLNAYMVVDPYSGISFTPATGEVTAIFNNNTAKNELRVGDFLVKVGNILFKDYQSNLGIILFKGYHKGDLIPIEVLRDGKPQSLLYFFPGVTNEEVFDRLNSQWITPLVFWVAGTAILLFLRPRNQIRFIFFVFCSTTAIWVSAGNLSASHLYASPIIMRAMIWIALPIYLHLHWLFPKPFRNLPVWFICVFYFFSGIMAIGEIFRILPNYVYSLGFVTALIGSLALLSSHYIFQPETRKTFRWLLIALGLVVLPMVLIAILLYLGITPWFAPALMFGVSALPGFYFYTIYQQQNGLEQGRLRKLLQIYFLTIFGGIILTLLVTILPGVTSSVSLTSYLSIPYTVLITLEAFASFGPFLILPALSKSEIKFYTKRDGGIILRANRAASMVFFAMITITFSVILAILLERWMTSPENTVIMAVLTGWITTIFAFHFYKPFEQFFNQKVLAISIQPDLIIKTYTEKLATCLDIDTFRDLLMKEIMPSLLIRQFSIIMVGEANANQFSLIMGAPVQDYQGVNSPVPLSRPGFEIDSQTPIPEKYIPSWTQLVLPLKVENSIKGYLILGHRDPDDKYPSEDIELLKTLAYQTALAYTNISKTESLKALYREDIIRHEGERVHLAAELHDVVLNQLAVMAMNLDLSSPPAKQAYEQTNSLIREIIKGLRPVMLQYGLFDGLNELTDELTDQFLDKYEIRVEIPESDVRYPNEVEMHMFRIIQQAINNAINHSECSMIILSGKMEPDNILLMVQDNGKGFDSNESLDLSGLLMNKHFGLAGMFERAEVISAKIKIESEKGKGSLITVTWQP